MKEKRPCPRAYNEPERVYGFAPEVLSGVFVVFALLMVLPISKLLSVFISVIAFVVAYWYSRFEIQIKIFVRAFFQSARYTPEKRRIERREIK
jgi:hypothetical protein